MRFWRWSRLRFPALLAAAGLVLLSGGACANGRITFRSQGCDAAGGGTGQWVLFGGARPAGARFEVRAGFREYFPCPELRQVRELAAACAAGTDPAALTFAHDRDAPADPKTWRVACREGTVRSAVALPGPAGAWTARLAADHRDFRRLRRRLDRCCPAPP